MANPQKIVPGNAPGNWFVDTTCIDCDTCRQLAPAIFGDADGYSLVTSQPRDRDEERAAAHALLACPTGSIGTRGPNRAKEMLADFPLPIERNVFYCGFTSPKSYGGSSYFIRHAGGNWLVDSPKFLTPLVERFTQLGGLAHIFLTHEDDVADAARYADHFGARRIIHRLEIAAQPNAELVFDGSEPSELAPGFVGIPTPGHTAGHLALLVADRYLFTGDHLAWDGKRQRLTAFRDYCWHSWDEQQRSLVRLLDYSFAWILPGHGERVHLPADSMRRELTALIERLSAPEQPAE